MYLTRLDDDTDPKVTFDSSKLTELILGRGPVLKITDTKVSRNQAKIHFDPVAKKFTFVNLSVKPCYHKIKEDDDWTFVEKDEIIPLENDHVIGLLPHKFIYQINAIKTHPNILNKWSGASKWTSILKTT
jgi:hypothetical protein